jgi:hypothetical protein
MIFRLNDSPLVLADRLHAKKDYDNEQTTMFSRWSHSGDLKLDARVGRRDAGTDQLQTVLQDTTTMLMQILLTIV